MQHAVQQVMWLVVTEVQSESLGLVTQHHPYNAHPTYALLSYVLYLPSSSVVSCAFSALCVYSKFRHHPHPLGYLCAKCHFLHGLHCGASPWRKTAYSITHSLSHSLIWCPGNRSFHFRTTAYLWWPTNSVGALKGKFWTYYRSFVHEMWSMTTTPSQYIDAFCQLGLDHYCKFHPQPVSLTLSLPILLRLYTLPYWHNSPFLIFDIWIWAMWHLGLSARAPECQKLKIVG